MCNKIQLKKNELGSAWLPIMAATHSPPHNIAFFLTSINGAVYFVAFVLKIVTVFQPSNEAINHHMGIGRGFRLRISGNVRARATCAEWWAQSCAKIEQIIFTSHRNCAASIAYTLKTCAAMITRPYGCRCRTHIFLLNKTRSNATCLAKVMCVIY